MSGERDRIAGCEHRELARAGVSVRFVWSFDASGLPTGVDAAGTGGEAGGAPPKISRDHQSPERLVAMEVQSVQSDQSSP